MFEKALVRRTIQDSAAMDLGLVAETLLFYQHVLWMLDQGSLTDILRTLGPDVFFYLLDNGFINATFVPNRSGVHTHVTGGIPEHSFVFMELKGHEKRRFEQDDQLIPEIFSRALGEEKPSKKPINRFLDKVPFRRLGQHKGKPDGLGELMMSDAEDDTYVNRAIRAVLCARVPNLVIPDQWHFYLIRTERGFVVDTNFDFDGINENVPSSCVAGAQLDNTGFAALHLARR